MQKKHVFSDWMEVEAGYGKAQEGFKPSGASPYGIKLKMHNPKVETDNPVLCADKPWEEWRTGSYQSLAKVGNKYKCWYESYGTWKDYYLCLCYAESDDGLNWIKPNLGIIEFRGSKENNIVDIDSHDHGYFVMYEEDAPEEEKYKMVYTHMYQDETGKRHIETKGAVSADGFHWNKFDKPFFDGGDTNLALTKRGNKYIIYSREIDPEIIHRRTFIYAESETFGNFSDYKFMKTNDPLDSPDVDYYQPDVMKWPGTDSVFVSLQCQYHRSTDLHDLHLELSRNGYEFRPVSREPFIPLSEYPPLDKCMYPSGGEIVDLGDGRWIFHIACSEYSHNDKLDFRTYPHGWIFRAFLREDGFVSVRADSYGSFQTQPLYMTGNNLEINCDYELRGHIKIGIIDNEEDKLVEGFELENCEEIERGKIWQCVKWKSGKSLKDLDKTKRYRIKFNMHMADIYAYKF